MKIIPIEQLPRPRRHGQEREMPAEETAAGRAVATQRDVVMFRTAELGSDDPGAATPFVVQRLAQLWPAPPLAADHALAVAAYSRTAATPLAPSDSALALVA